MNNTITKRRAYKLVGNLVNRDIFYTPFLLLTKNGESEIGTY